MKVINTIFLYFWPEIIIKFATSKTEPYIYKNSIKPLQRNLFYIVFLTIFLTFGNTLTFAQDGKKPTESFPPKNQTTTTEEKKIATEEIAKVDIDTNKVNKKKPLLEHKVKRKAVDYEKIDQKKKLITLYNQAEVYYDDIELKAGIIVIDYQKNEVYAGRIKDSTGKYTQLPVF